MATIEYTLRIVDRPGEPFLLIADWTTEEGEWRSSIPILRQQVEHSNFDLIGQEIRSLESRIRKRSPHHKVEQVSLEIPPGWSSHRGPDAMFKRKEKRINTHLIPKTEDTDNEQTA